MIKLDKKMNGMFEKKRLRSKKHLQTAADRPRMVVNRSNKYLYVQVIDDKGKVICAYSSISKELEGKRLGKDIKSAKAIGTEIGKKLKAKKVTKVAFDRNGLLYHGKVKALAEACREQGIEF